MGAGDGGGERDGETGEVAEKLRRDYCFFFEFYCFMFSLDFSLRRTVLPREQPAGMK